MERGITVTESIHVRAAPEVVFDLTQDDAHRSEGYGAMLAAVVLERPRRTEPVMEDVRSFLVVEDGGSRAGARRRVLRPRLRMVPLVEHPSDGLPRVRMCRTS